MKKFFISASITILFLCLGSGCFYIPYFQYIYKVPDEKTLASIKEGVTSKEDILMMLGEPDRVGNNERFFIYWWLKKTGYIAGYPADLVPLTDISVMYINFDENNIVKKLEIIRKGVSDKFHEGDEYFTE